MNSHVLLHIVHRAGEHLRIAHRAGEQSRVVTDCTQDK